MPLLWRASRQQQRRPGAEQGARDPAPRRITIRCVSDTSRPQSPSVARRAGLGGLPSAFSDMGAEGCCPPPPWASLPWKRGTHPSSPSREGRGGSPPALGDPGGALAAVCLSPHVGREANSQSYLLASSAATVTGGRGPSPAAPAALCLDQAFSPESGAILSGAPLPFPTPAAGPAMPHHPAQQANGGPGP